MAADEYHPSLEAEYQARFRYRTEKRPAKTLEAASFQQLGHMLETLVDALIAIGQMENNPQLDVMHELAYEPINYAQEGHLDYLSSVTTDPRTAKSFFRSDLDRSREGKIYPDLAALADDLHMALRKQTIALGTAFTVPEELQPLAKKYDAELANYKKLLDEHKRGGKIDFANIQPEELERFNARFNDVAKALFERLRALSKVTIRINGEFYTLPNDKLLNERMPDSFPAIFLFRFGNVGRVALDRNRRPEVEFEKWSRDVTGSESLISDTTHRLLELAKKEDVPLRDSIDREEVKENLSKCTRQLKLALAFAAPPTVSIPGPWRIWSCSCIWPEKVRHWARCNRRMKRP